MTNLKPPFSFNASILAQITALSMLLVLCGCAGVSSSSKSSTPPPPTPVPAITSLSPNSGAAGAPVIITGKNFGSTPATVTFNGKTASVSSWSDTQIATKVPSGATSGNVVVTVSGQASNLAGFTVLTSSSVPAISSLSPNSGAVGAAVSIVGTNFGSSSGSVTFNGTSAFVSSWTDTLIEATVPSGATSGNVVVTANTGASNGVSFTVVAASSAPTITDLSPTSGTVGQAVTITGTNFGSATGTVTFNGTNAQVGSWTDTSIATTVPTGATTGLVVVIAGNTGSNGVDFTVQGPSPNITALYPTTGVVGALVTIEGSNFGSTQGNVIFNGTTAPIVKWSGSKITTKVPPGATSGNVVVTVGSGVSNGVDFTVGAPSVGAITAAYFGFQCGSGVVTGANNCTNTPGTKNPTWPTSLAQPGLLRLWDSQVSWSYLMSGYSNGAGTYSWAELDGYLDMLAAHQPEQANYVFGCVPAFVASGPTGSTPGSCGLNGSASPPVDLTVDGSPTFNQFVTDLVNHCSPAGNCMKDLVTGYELWNEANVSTGLAIRWTGTQLQLYQMVSPAVAIINSKVPNARILTPSIVSGPAGSLPAKWMQSWLSIEAQNGIISNYINIHQYMNNNAPEDISNIWSGSIGPNTATTGWTPVPWIMGETSWDDIVLPYGCNDGNTGTLFSTSDCIGQMVRWNLILLSNGSAGVYWYYWNTNIGQYSNYSTGFYYMMQYLQGGTFGGPCSANAQGIWTCSFTEAGGTQALWVWVPNEAGAAFTVPAGYSDYLDLTGGKTSVTAGSNIGVTVAPILLEQ